MMNITDVHLTLRMVCTQNGKKFPHDNEKKIICILCLFTVGKFLLKKQTTPKNHPSPFPLNTKQGKWHAFKLVVNENNWFIITLELRSHCNVVNDKLVHIYDKL